MRVKLPATALLAAAAIGVGAAGCGTSTQTATAYRAAASRACRTDTAAIRQLPKILLDRHLSFAQVHRIGTKDAARFTAAMRALKPPSALASANHKLLTELAAQPKTGVLRTRSQLNPVVAHEHRLLRDYQALGISGCNGPLRTELGLLAHARARLPG